VRPYHLLLTLLVLAGLLAAVACSGDDDDTGGTPAAQTSAPAASVGPTGAASPTEVSGSVTVYSGRSEELVQPVLDDFEAATGIEVNVRYGDTAELAATILEEGGNSPADLYFAQDAGALGALAAEGRLAELPDEILQLVPSQYRSPSGLWVGISGRARVVAYNTDVLSPDDLPGSILDFTDPQWDGRIGWAPTNGSFQAFVTALRLTEGEEEARAWLEGILDNNPTEYPNNTTAVDGVANGEVDVAFVNHYYLYRFLEEQGMGFPARNYFLDAGDPGALVNVAGAAVLDSADHPDAALKLIEYMLSQEGQQYFSDETYEYPLVEGVEPSFDLLPLSEIDPPDIDLSDLDDLEGTLDLLRETGALP